MSHRGKGNDHLLDTVSQSEGTSRQRHLRMARIVKGFHSVTCMSTCMFIYEWNEPYLPVLSQLKLVLINRPRRDGRLSWPKNHHSEWIVCPGPLPDGYLQLLAVQTVTPHWATGLQWLRASNPRPLGPWAATVTTETQSQPTSDFRLFDEFKGRCQQGRMHWVFKTAVIFVFASVLGQKLNKNWCHFHYRKTRL